MPKLHRLRPAELVAETVTITWNPLTSTYTAHCQQCADSATGRYGWLYEWAETHDCDAEIVALLLALEPRAA